MSNELNPTPSFWHRLGCAFIKVLRIVLILAIVAGIAAAVYFGTPYLYEKFILPVETNTARLSEVESKQATEVNQLTDQISSLQTRLTELENRQTDNAQSMAETQGRIQALESSVETQNQAIKQLESMQITLDKLSASYAEHDALLVGNNSALADLQRQVTLSRSIELLSRARLYFSQSNFGLAQQDVLAARELLSTLQSGMPAEKAGSLQGVIQRLDMALGNLPAFPVVAVDDVDIAWQFLVNGLPDDIAETPTTEPVNETPTPTQEITPTATP